MLAKFSVRKPFTVLVAVVLVIVLGVVSFQNMTPDLLPEIELPYVVVMTTYVGATPETVEREVTRPVEQSLSTLDHVDTVTSTSGANFSVVFLQFTDDAGEADAAAGVLERRHRHTLHPEDQPRPAAGQRGSRQPGRVRYRGAVLYGGG